MRHVKRFVVGSTVMAVLVAGLFSPVLAIAIAALVVGLLGYLVGAVLLKLLEEGFDGD